MRSRQLRAEASEAEKKLWWFLRRRQFGDLRFRRQFPLGPYFADFVCLSARLVIEIDGSHHLEPAQMAHDARRTRWVEENRFRVIRFSAVDVMANVQSVLAGIEHALAQPLPRMSARVARVHSPPPARGRGT